MSRRCWGVRDWLLWAVLCTATFVILGAVFAATDQLSGHGFAGVPLFAACYWPAAFASALSMQAWRWYRNNSSKEK